MTISDEAAIDLLAEVAVRFQAAAQQIDRRFVGMEDRYATRRWLELGVREGCPGPLTGVTTIISPVRPTRRATPR